MILIDRPFLTPFRAAHADYIDMQDVDAQVVFATRDFRRNMKAFEKGGFSWTGIVGTRIIGCGGIVDLWPGVAYGWLICSGLAKTYKMFLYKTVKNAILAADSRGIHRIEAAIYCKNDTAISFAIHLGFESEGLMRKYDSNGKDFLRYARIKC